MSSSPQKRCAPAARAAAGPALAIAFCIALAGCQSHDTARHKKGDELVQHKPLRQPQMWKEGADSVTHYQDIWARIRDGFQLQDLARSNTRVDYHRRLFASHSATVEIASERSAPYIHYIVERLEEKDMPLELALLPIIESAYNPLAYSPAHAVGLWQFVPATGRYYNLQQTSTYDGRRDVTASTNAALRYLSYLHEYFGGDWLLAIAAYNAGEGTVSRAIERNEQKGLPTDFWNLPLPEETRNYVPKLLAVSQLVMSPANYGITLSPVANEPYFESVVLNKRVPLAHVAQLVDLDEEELFLLNPAFKHRVVPAGPTPLLVPAEKAQMLAANLASLREVPPAPEPAAVSAPARNRTYRVQRGDTLSSIARRYEVTLASLVSSNRLRSQQVKPGQQLTIPGTASGQPAHTTVASAAMPAASSRKTPATHKVRAGETLWAIAEKYQLPVASLQRWNRLAGNTVKSGQVLQLQAPEPATVASLSSSRVSVTYYKVKAGDSLNDIARRFNVQVKALKRWNPSSRELQPGQMLTLHLL